MFTLLSTLLGFGTSFLPKVIGFFEKKQDNKHEIELLKLQGELNHQSTKDGVTVAQIRSENKRMLESIKAETASVKYQATWVNTLRASVRPIITYLFFVVFISVEATAVYLGVTQGGDWATVVAGLWSEDINSIFAAIIAFWFGSRAIKFK